MSLKKFANLRHIALALHRDYRRKMVYIAYGLTPAARYKEFTIPKKSGGTRRICAPRIALLKLQRDILCLLEGDYRPRAHVHGFVGRHQRSIVSNARQHVGKRWVLNIDFDMSIPIVVLLRYGGSGSWFVSVSIFTSVMGTGFKYARNRFCAFSTAVSRSIIRQSVKYCN